MNAIIEQVYLSRIDAIRTLRRPHAAKDLDDLKSSADRVRGNAALFGRAPAAKVWTMFADAVDCVRLLTEWNAAAVTAEVDADRFLRAARLRLEQMSSAAGSTVYERELLECLQPIGSTITLAAISAIRSRIASIPMPVGIYADPEPVHPSWAREAPSSSKGETDELTVAFLEFTINGKPAEGVNWLPPRQTHDLEIAIRVSRWPHGAESIRLSPVSVEPKATYDLPVFEFERPVGDPPYHFVQRGRMVLHAPQSVHARPYEFMYAAEFSPTKSEQPVVVAGQRTLRLDGADSSQNPITGYPGIDQKILRVRDWMRRKSGFSEREVGDALILMAPLGNLMGQAVQDARYSTPVSEAVFQADIRMFLRQSPQIGVELEEQAQVTGGRTDLSFRGIRIELKSEQHKKLAPVDCESFAKQAASYAVGTNRRLAFLCVLDSSTKTEGPFPIDDGLFVIPITTSTAPVYVITYLIQGGLPKPSALSR